MRQNNSLWEKESGNHANDAHTELIDVAEVAHLCGMSQSMYKKLHSMEMTPEGIKLGRLRRWRRTEILAWIEAGCPNRDKWLVAKNGQRKVK